MKKTVIGIILAALVLVGCGSSENVISGDVENVVTENAQEEESGSQDLPEKKQEEEESGGNKGYVFEVKDIAIEIDAEAEGYIEALGEPLSYYEAPSCAFGDLDKIYTYNGFEMDTYSLEGKDYVSAIIFKDDSVTTPEGICIGEDAEKVKEVYGEPTEEKDGNAVYGKDGMKLNFLIQDDKVVSIEYLSTVLE